MLRNCTRMIAASTAGARGYHWSGLDRGGAVDLVDRLGKGRLEFGVAHRDAKVLDKRAREARDYAVGWGEQLASVATGIAAGESDDPGDTRMIDQRPVEVGNAGQGQLEHYLPAGRQRVGPLFQFVEQDHLGAFLVRAFDRDLRLEDRHQPMLGDAFADLELLRGDRGDPFF